MSVETLESPQLKQDLPADIVDGAYPEYDVDVAAEGFAEAASDVVDGISTTGEEIRFDAELMGLIDELEESMGPEFAAKVSEIGESRAEEQVVESLREQVVELLVMSKSLAVEKSPRERAESFFQRNRLTRAVGKAALGLVGIVSTAAALKYSTPVFSVATLGVGGGLGLAVLKKGATAAGEKIFESMADRLDEVSPEKLKEINDRIEAEYPEVTDPSELDVLRWRLTAEAVTEDLRKDMFVETATTHLDGSKESSDRLLTKLLSHAESFLQRSYNQSGKLKKDRAGVIRSTLSKATEAVLPEVIGKPVASTIKKL
jgi:hypothetical protein